jgi:hypothetical protein
MSKNMKTAQNFEELATTKGELRALETLCVDDSLGGVMETEDALMRAKTRSNHMNSEWGLKFEGTGIHVKPDGASVIRPANEHDCDGVHDSIERQTHFECAHLGATIERKFSVISMSQQEHLTKVLARLGHGNPDEAGKKPVKSPFPGGWKPRACLDHPDVTAERKTHCRSAVAAVNHAATQTRPDLKLPVSVLARYFNNPKDEHFMALDYLLRYIRHTIEWRIEFSKKLENHDSPEKLMGFCDASFADCKDTRRSRSGWVWMLANGPLMWQSTIQKSMKPAKNTAISELVAATSCLEDGNYLFTLTREVGQDFRVNMVTIKEDNQAVMRVVQNRWTSPRTKSIDIRCFWVRAHVINGLVKFEFTSTKDQAADALTKILTVAERIKHFGRMGMKFNQFEG